MEIEREILEFLRAEYAKGFPYQELAKRYGVSYTYLRGLITGKNPIGRISLDMFFHFFPRATVNLHGDTPSVSMSVGNGNENIRQSISNDERGNMESYQLRLYRAMAGLDIAADAKLKVLETLNQLQ